MGRKLIRISTRQTGERRWVRIYIYDDLATMQAEADAFNGTDNSMAAGVTQAYQRDGLITLVIIRLWTGALSGEIVGHEVHHASTVIYGSALPKRISRDKVFALDNEMFAHLHSDLEGKLINRLHALGYYGGQR